MSAGEGLLAEIRAAELEAGRRVEEARVAAAQRVTDARVRAADTVEGGRRSGVSEARRRYEAAVAGAEVEAARISNEIPRQVEETRRVVEPRLAGLVDLMVDLILAPPQERGV